MKWLLCLMCLSAGLLSGTLVNRWLRDGADASGIPPELSTQSSTSPAIHGARSKAFPAASAQTAWDQLMDRARTESLPDLAALPQRQGAGPLDYLGRIERELALWRAIERGEDPAAICSILTAVTSTASGAPNARDWTPRNMDVAKFLLWQLGGRDPQGTLNALGKGNLETLGPVFAAWAEKDPQAALKAADGNYHDLNRAYAVVTVLSRIARSDFPEALRLAGSLKKEGEDPVSGLLRSIAANQPEKALELLLDPGRGLDAPQTSDLVRETVQAFADGPGHSVWPVLGQLAEQPDLMEAAAESLGRNAVLPVSLPPEARALFEKLPPAAQEKALVSGMALALYRSDPGDADRVLSGLPEETAANALAAAAEAAFRGEGGLDFPVDPALAQNIASRLPSERQLELLDSWRGRLFVQPEQAEAWLAAMEDPNGRDQFAEKFARVIGSSNYPGAAKLAASIADQTRREAVLGSILQEWQAKFPAAAEECHGLWQRPPPPGRQILSTDPSLPPPTHAPRARLQPAGQRRESWNSLMRVGLRP